MNIETIDLFKFLEHLCTEIGLPPISDKDNFVITGLNTKTLGQITLVKLNTSNGLEIKTTLAYCPEMKIWRGVDIVNLLSDQKQKLFNELIDQKQPHNLIADLLKIPENSIPVLILHRF